MKPDNILVDYSPDDAANRFADVQLADFGSTSHIDSKYARRGAPIGAPIWRSPEALFKQPWNTATDIWSFGTLVSAPSPNLLGGLTCLFVQRVLALCGIFSFHGLEDGTITH